MLYKIYYGVILDNLLILICQGNSTTLATTLNVVQLYYFGYYLQCYPILSLAKFSQVAT
jgi:hypothetical protein